MHVFKHPKYYEEYRKRARLAQKELKASQEKKAISPEESTDSDGRTPGTHPDLLPAHGPEYYAPRRKRRSSSNKQQATSKQEGASNQQSTSSKAQATSLKP